MPSATMVEYRSRKGHKRHALVIREHDDGTVDLAFNFHVAERVGKDADLTIGTFRELRGPMPAAKGYRKRSTPPAAPAEPR